MNGNLTRKNNFNEESFGCVFYNEKINLQYRFLTLLMPHHLPKRATYWSTGVGFLHPSNNN